MNLFGRKNDDNTQQEDNENKQPARGGMNPILRIVIAAYLTYISYGLTRDILAEGVNSNNWYFLVFVAIFVVFAIWLAIQALKQLKESKEKSDAEFKELIAEEQEEEYLRSVYTKEDLEAFEKEQALLAEEDSDGDQE